MSAHAQQPPDAGSLLEQTRKRPAAEPRTSPNLLPRAPEPKPALGAPGLKLVVKGFRISGNTIYSEKELLPTIQEFVGKEQTIDGLNDAATKVRAYYRERGYFLSQAYLPQQEIEDGVVEIAVIEARVGKVAERMHLYGGLITENVDQAISRDLIAAGALRAEAMGYMPVLTVHDEVVTEVPEGAGDVRELEELISTGPSWADGCRVTAEGWRGKRYRK